MESAILGLVLDSSIIIEAERKHQTVEELLAGVQERFGEIEISMSAVTVAELVHGIARAKKQEIRERRRAFIDELKNFQNSSVICHGDANTCPWNCIISRDPGYDGVA